MYEKNLISISKLIFKLTRCENNDAIFLEEKTVHSLLNVLNQQKVHLLDDCGLNILKIDNQLMKIIKY